LFENIIVGGEEVLAGRKEKPDRGIFMKACKYVGCLPSEAIHVGDSLGADIQGGINAELLATVFINVKSRDASTFKPMPTYTIKHIAELKEIIDKLLVE
jgi:N-acylneuraminate-9-phosphatase